jgi:hypothetical protein
MTMTENPFTEYRLGAGFHRISKTEYLADPAPEPSLSSSIAKMLVSQSPAHAWCAHPRGANHRKDPTAAMLNGTLIDSLLCGGDTEIVELPEEMPDSKGKMVPTNDAFRLDSAKKWRDEHAAAGRLPVSRDDYSYARTAVDEIRANLWKDYKLELKGEKQVTGLWQEENGVWCRMRMDEWQADEGLIVDVKTAENANPKALPNHCYSFGYDIQDAAYRSGVETILPALQGRVRMLFAFCETTPPYACVVTPLAGTLRAVGSSRWKAAVTAWGECVKSGKFPGYTVEEGGIEAPHHALLQMEEAMAGGSPVVPF